jgi:hypothetical protein
MPPSPRGVAQLVECVLYHSTCRAVPERSWVQCVAQDLRYEKLYGFKIGARETEVLNG